MPLYHRISCLFVFLFLWACADQNPASKGQEPTNTNTSNTVRPSVETDSLGLKSETVGNASPESSVETGLEKQENLKYQFRYDIKNPDRKVNLPSELVEISALAYNVADQTLLAVNDEKGRVYNLNAKDGSIIKKIKFAGAGDYEGVEMTGNTIYVLKANGRILPIDTQSWKTGAAYKTPLTTSNDVEGLGYDPLQNALILACKGAGALKKKSKLKNTKAFYAFDLAEKKLVEKPKFVITDKALEKFLDQKEKALDGLSKKAKKKLENRITSFSPSAIAKHPKSGHYYILSSVGKLLVVCNEKGGILSVQFLDKKQFIQPEGICFSPDGTMYISNEGKSLVANFLVFSYR